MNMRYFPHGRPCQQLVQSLSGLELEIVNLRVDASGMKKERIIEVGPI
jgi:hypothetical protein